MSSDRNNNSNENAFAVYKKTSYSRARCFGADSSCDKNAADSGDSSKRLEYNVDMTL